MIIVPIVRLNKVSENLELSMRIEGLLLQKIQKLLGITPYFVGNKSKHKNPSSY